MVVKWAIWKYPLRLEENVQAVYMPYYANVLSVQLQQGKIALYVQVAINMETGDPFIDKEFKQFQILATGQEIEGQSYADLRYIGTVQLENGMTFHIHEVRGSGS